MSLGCSEEGPHEPCPARHSLFRRHKSQLPPRICHHFLLCALLTGRATSPASQDGLCPCTRLPAHLQPGEIQARAFTQARLAPPGPGHKFTLTLNFRGTHRASGSDLLNTDPGDPPVRLLCPTKLSALFIFMLSPHPSVPSPLLKGIRGCGGYFSLRGKGFNKQMPSKAPHPAPSTDSALQQAHPWRSQHGDVRLHPRSG